MTDKTINGTFGETSFINGVAQFTLKHGQTVSIPGLPAAIGYEVTETVDEDYEVRSSKAKGTIAPGQITEVSFINEKVISPEPETGGLAVQKIVSGKDIDETQEFSFVVKLDAPKISGTYGNMYFENGVARFKLTHEESIAAIGLPAGVHYTVGEVFQGSEVPVSSGEHDGFKVVAAEEQGTIVAGETVTAVFDNQKLATPPEPEKGNLTVSKTVTGDGLLPEQKFSFTVTLLNSGITGMYGEMSFENGVAQFELGNGDSIDAVGLPAGIMYQVAEFLPDSEEPVNSGTYGEFTVESKDAEGTILAGKTIVAMFVNHKELPPEPEKTGDLTVSKTVQGSGADPAQEFLFTVSLSDTTVNGFYGDMDFREGIASFRLHHGQNMTAIGLPAGISYTVTESDNEGYDVQVTGDRGVIREKEVQIAAFINVKESNGGSEPERHTGFLIVKTVVSGNDADKTHPFSFRVILDQDITGVYGEMQFIDGVAVFDLIHGQTCTAAGLPAGIQYAVEVSNTDGYTVTAQGETGVILTNTESLAIFDNHKDKNPGESLEPVEPDINDPEKPDNPPPQTGENSKGAYFMFAAVVSAVILFCSFLFKKRPSL